MREIKNVIVLCDFAFYGGGASKIALNSAIQLSKSGLNVRLFSGVGPIAPTLIESGVDVVCLDQGEILSRRNLAASISGIWNITAASRLRSLLESLDPRNTVIHAHQWVKSLSAAVLFVAKVRGFPFVVTFHDYFMVCPNGAFIDYPSNTICRREPMSRECVLRNCDSRNYGHKLWRVARQLVQGEIANMPRSLMHGIFLSDFSKRILQPHLPNHLTWHRLPNPAANSQEPRVDVAKNKAFVFVGQLAPHKGATLLAEAGRRAGVPLVFVGAGEERNEIQRINPGATVTGWIDSEEVLSHLQKARCLVFPSVWYECQPLAVLEALSLGVPVIVSDECAAIDSVDDGETGYSFKRASVEDLINKIDLLKDDDTVDELSRHAYHRFWAQALSPENHAIMTKDVYERMLSMGSG